MKIKKISGVNFFNFDRFDVDFDNANLFVGSNGSGKTNIAQRALYFLLTGDYDYMPIKTGSKSLEVDGDLIINGTEVNINRKLSASTEAVVITSKRGAMEGKPKEVTEKFLHRLGMTAERLKSLIFTQYFHLLPGTARKDILFADLNITVYRETLKEWLEKNDKEINWDMVIDGMLESDPGIFERSDSANEATFIERRKRKKRELEELQSKLSETGAKVESIEPGSLEKLREKITDLEKSLNTVQAALREKKKIPEMKTELEGIEKRLSFKKLTESETKALEEARNQINEINSTVLPYLSTKQTLTAEKAVILEKLEGANKLKGTCPLCGKKITAADAKKHREELEASLKEVEEKLNGVNKFLEEKRIEKDNVQKFIVAKEAIVKAYPSQDLITELRDRQDTLSVKIAEIEEIPADGEAELRESLDLCKQEEAGLKKILSREDIGLLSEKIAAVNQDITINDLMAKAFGDKGVRKTLLIAKVSELNTLASTYAKPLNYGEIEFRIETVDRKETVVVIVGGRNILSYSYAEQLALSIPIQMARVKLSGFGILTIDNLDHIRLPLSGKVQRLILDNKEFETLNIIKATNEDDEPGKLPDGINRYILKNGSIQKG